MLFPFSSSLIVLTKQPILINVVFSLFSFLLTFLLIPKAIPNFLRAKRSGFDLNKPKQPEIPESLGIVTACIYLVCLSFFIPVPFMKILYSEKDFPHTEYVELICGILSICYMVLLGFADDLLDLRWRYKLILPTIATVPLLMVYRINNGSTYVLIPTILKPIFGRLYDFGMFYYVFLCLIGIFCTNSINILAGINGIEAGQSLIISISILINNLILSQYNQLHQTSLYFILPFIAVTTPLTYYNWFPAQVFVGDTFCYFAGMTFTVSAILGHFTKTLLLFFIPQLLNFFYSLPQLLKLFPCPRHRMPKLDQTTGVLQNSFILFDPKKLNFAAKWTLSFLKTFDLVKILQQKDGNVMMSNLTLINFFIYKFGDAREDKVISSFLVFCL